MTTESDKMDTHKKGLLKALAATGGVVATACKKANMGRSTFYNYLNEDPEFRAAVEETKEEAKDLIETAAMKRVRAGSDTMIIFMLKTRCRDRGYVERVKNDVKTTITVVRRSKPLPDHNRPESEAD